MVQIWGRVPPLTETIARIDAVTVQGVRDFGGHLATSAPVAMALYGPVEAAPDLAGLNARRAA
jgi:hypothetical protein